MNVLQSSHKPTVLLLTKQSSLAVLSAELLLKSSCKVLVLTDDVEKFRSRVNFPYDSNELEIVNFQNVNINTLVINYIVFFSESVEVSDDDILNTDKTFVDIAIGLSKRLNVISLFIFPYSVSDDVNKEALSTAENFVKDNRDLAGILFLGELIGPRINISTRRFISGILKDISSSSPLRLPTTDLELIPLSTGIAAEHIVRSLFAFGSLGERVAYISQRISAKDFISLIKKIKPTVNMVYTDDKYNYEKYGNISNQEILEDDLEQVLEITLNSFAPRMVVEEVDTIPIPEFLKHINPVKEPSPVKQLTQEVEIPLIKITPPASTATPSKPLETRKKRKSIITKKTFNALKLKIKIPKRITKKQLSVLGVVLVVFAFPYLLIFSGSALLYLEKSQITLQQFKQAKFTNTTANTLFGYAYTELKILEDIPVAGSFFESSAEMARVANETTRLFSSAYTVADLGTFMLDHVLGGGSQDVSVYTDRLSLELDKIYQDLSFLQSDLPKAKGPSGYFLNKVFGSFDISQVRNKAEFLSDLIEEAPSLLGKGGKKTYLVLFQDNTELRPTGGLIRAYALVTFDNGKLLEMNVQKVSDADGRLKGFIDPPAPVKEYLGKSAWYLRDSNWDPDFPASAQTAEWFLDKEIDVNVDGVIAVNLEAVKKLIAITGPIKLSAGDKTITSDNIYELTQSDTKDELSTMILTDLLTRVTNIQKEKYLDITKVLYESLEQKNIQVFLHSPSSQKSLSLLNWNGAVDQGSCKDNCYSDFLGVVEANIGSNKENLYLERSMSLETTLKESGISRALRLDIKNTGGLAYKAYVRVLAPRDSNFTRVDKYKAQDLSARINPDINTVKDITEAGVYLVVEPRSTATLIFRWDSLTQLNYRQGGRYFLSWRKQSGTHDDPIYVNILTPLLTTGRAESYNTTLSRDFDTHLSW